MSVCVWVDGGGGLVWGCRRGCQCVCEWMEVVVLYGDVGEGVSVCGWMEVVVLWGGVLYG